MRELLANTSPEPDPELSRAVMCTAYTLSSGESLLVFETGKGMLDPSREFLAATNRRRVEEAKRQFDAPRPIVPDAETFVDRVPNLLATFPALIGVPAALLDKSERSRDVVDRAIRKLGPDRMLEPDMFSALMAYLGEVIRGLTHGSWTIESPKAAEHVPRIVDANGVAYLPSRLAKELLEPGPRASSRAFVAGTVFALAPTAVDPPRSANG